MFTVAISAFAETLPAFLLPKKCLNIRVKSDFILSVDFHFSSVSGDVMLAKKKPSGYMYPIGTY